VPVHEHIGGCSGPTNAEGTGHCGRGGSKPFRSKFGWTQLDLAEFDRDGSFEPRYCPRATACKRNLAAQIT
jgi:hypothetical protein